MKKWLKEINQRYFRDKYLTKKEIRLTSQDREIIDAFYLVQSAIAGV